jgi:hypothetical protein
MSFEDSMSEVEGMDKPSEAGEVFDMVIDSTDVTGLTNERDFPVPSEPRPVRVAVYGN